MRNWEEDELDERKEEIVNMDDEKLKLIWKRMFNMSLHTKGEKVSRRDFLERICLESELKDF